MRPVLLVKYGELALKGQNRPYFEKTLADNIRQAISDVCGDCLRVVRVHGRIVVEPFHEEGQKARRNKAAQNGVGPEEAASQSDRKALRRAADALRRVFGVVEMSLAYSVAADMTEIIRAAIMAAEEAREELTGEAREEFTGEEFKAGRRVPGVIPSDVPAHDEPVRAITFKVTTRRADKDFPLDSPTINAVLGREILCNVDGLSVDVHNPDFVVTVEVRREGAFVYYKSVKGPGGLPVGVSGKGLLLLSGGIDSPVAGWMGMKRGLVMEAVHFDSFPLTSERSREKVFDLCKVLSRWQVPIPVVLHLVSFADIQKTIWKGGFEELRVTVMRRAMLQISNLIAQRTGAQALITGESLGQVASQTLESVDVINRASTLPVLRPLIGFDKTEIVALAKEIGTFPVSIRPYEDCCSIFVPRHPATRPSLDSVLAVEKRLNLGPLIFEALERVSTYSFASV
ncbi:MAG TPA: tRNA 4-thiouridine(8) synthase ThiI [Clostridia bacterium]|nr:tRNA 4-thiouridine(8) synthase ThiI [Clostridia bacterium]